MENFRKVGQRGIAMEKIFKALKRPTELGTPPWCQASITRPHGTGRVLDAELSREAMESLENVM